MCESLLSKACDFKTWISLNDFGTNGFAEVDSLDEKERLIADLGMKLIDFACFDFPLSYCKKSAHETEDSGTLGVGVGRDIL